MVLPCQNPPELSFSSSTILLEATVQSPVRLLIPRSSSTDAASIYSDTYGDGMGRGGSRTSSRVEEEGYCLPHPIKSDISRKLFSSSSKRSGDFSGVPTNLSSLNSSLLSTQERLNSLLGKYEGLGKYREREWGGEKERTQQRGRRETEWNDEEEDSRPRLSPCRVKFVPPVPYFRHIPGTVHNYV